MAHIQLPPSLPGVRGPMAFRVDLLLSTASNRDFFAIHFRDLMFDEEA